MKTQTFEVIIEKDKPKGYHAYCPALHGCHSQGRSIKEARENIAEAIQGYLESLIARKKPIPRPQTGNIVVERFTIPIVLDKKLLPA